MIARTTLLLGLAAALTATAQAQSQPDATPDRMAREPMRNSVIAVPRVIPPAPVMTNPALVSTPSTPGGGVARLVNTQPAASDAGRPSGPLVPPGQVTPLDNTIQPLGPNYLGLAPMPTERTFQNPPGHSFAPRAIAPSSPIRERQGSE